MTHAAPHCSTAPLRKTSFATTTVATTTKEVYSRVHFVASVRRCIHDESVFAAADAGSGDSIRMLEYKCKWYGRTLVKVDTFFPSSKLCCVCRQKNAELKLQDRWKCPNPECQTEHQRDENAVVNIFVEGLRILAEGRSVSACGGTVRLGCELKHVPVKQETSLETSSNAA